MNKRHAGLSALMSLVLLAGCSEVNQFLGNEESVNYKSAVTQRGEPLSIPPDLTQANSDPRYRAPASGSTTYSQFQQQGQAQATQPKTSNVLPGRQDMRVERRKTCSRDWWTSGPKTALPSPATILALA
jgi:outer membrane protein assembly factor BamC